MSFFILSIVGDLIVHRDKVIWLVCILLFASGALWGANIRVDNFFVVSSIHDFIEILGSLATILAVLLAMIGLNRWKVEVGAASDHELARRIAVSAQKYRIELTSLWQFADSASKQNESESWMIDQNSYSLGIYEHVLVKMKEARADLEAVVLEAHAIWGGIFEDGLSAAFQFENVCANTIGNYLYLCNTRPIESRFWDFSAGSSGCWKEFNSVGFSSGLSVEGRVDLIFQEIRVEVEKKLLRGLS